MNRKSVGLPLLVVMSLFCVSASAEEPSPSEPSPAEPQREHQWLQKFVGQWTTSSKGSMGPDQPPMECEGTMSSRSIGGLWVVNQMKTMVQGSPMEGVQTIGYETTKNRYVGTWVDSMFDFMWLYEGTVDESGSTLTLEAEGPNFMGNGKSTNYRDSYRFESPDRIVITSSMLGEDGQWITFMSGVAQRTNDHNGP